MAFPKEPVVICAPLTVAAGLLTRAAAVFSAGVPMTGKGGEWGYAVKNVGSAPSTGCVIILQTSHNGTEWYDYHTHTADPVNGSARSVWMSPGVMYARIGAYGHTTNPVEISSVLQGVAG